MATKNLHDRPFYEDIYDHSTVRIARTGIKSYEKMHEKFFEVMPDEKPNSLRSSLYLNLFYMVFVGNEMVDRYDDRTRRIDEMMAADAAKDERISDGRLAAEPACRHCGKTGLRIIDKLLVNRDGFDDEQVLFMLNCSSCSKKSTFWSDGIAWEHRRTLCPKCSTTMNETDKRKGKLITTTYSCPACRHMYKDELDLTIKEPEVDSKYELDRHLFCLIDEKNLIEHRDAKRRYEGMAEMGRQWKEKEDNKHIYDAIAELKKLKIAELIPLLTPELEKAGYTEFHLDQPEMGRDVYIGFSCLDSKSERDDYESRSTLKNLVSEVLKNTNWRLTTHGVSYRLGYLNGRLRAYERDEDLKKLVVKHPPKHG